ncbi:MAG: hypothetical protein EAY66_07120 [Sphingobacteriales bacterium]|jgi:hypothetical protein|nr:MAG: hypothetical protein EAY66_07120 [Sphingobacteriales bacterium]
MSTFFKCSYKILRTACLMALFLMQSFYCHACDPKLDPFCDDVNAVPLGFEDCDPLLDPYCEDVNVPIDTGVWVILSLTLLLSVYKIKKNHSGLVHNYATKPNLYPQVYDI